MSPVLLNWIALITGGLAVMMVLGYLATGRRHTWMRITAGVAVIVSVLSLAMS